MVIIKVNMSGLSESELSAALNYYIFFDIDSISQHLYTADDYTNAYEETNNIFNKWTNILGQLINSRHILVEKILSLQDGYKALCKNPNKDVNPSSNDNLIEKDNSGNCPNPNDDYKRRAVSPSNDNDIYKRQKIE